MDIATTITDVVTWLNGEGNSPPLNAHDDEVSPDAAIPWTQVYGPVSGEWSRSLDVSPAASALGIQITCVERTPERARQLADRVRARMAEAGHASDGPPSAPELAGSLWNVFETFRVNVTA